MKLKIEDDEKLCGFYNRAVAAWLATENPDQLKLL